jgi:hypothetical protein
MTIFVALRYRMESLNEQQMYLPGSHSFNFDSASASIIQPTVLRDILCSGSCMWSSICMVLRRSMLRSDQIKDETVESEADNSGNEALYVKLRTDTSGE